MRLFLLIEFIPTKDIFTTFWIASILVFFAALVLTDDFSRFKLDTVWFGPGSHRASLACQPNMLVIATTIPL